MEQPEFQVLPEPTPSCQLKRTPDPNLSLTPDKYCFISPYQSQLHDEHIPRPPRTLFNQSKTSDKIAKHSDDFSVVPLREVQENSTLKLQKKLVDLALSDLDASQELVSELKKSEKLRLIVSTKVSNHAITFF